MMRKLQAQENMNAAQVAGVGSGMMKTEDVRSIFRDWKAAAGQDEEFPKLTKEQGAIILAGLGIKTKWATNN